MGDRSTEPGRPELGSAPVGASGPDRTAHDVEEAHRQLVGWTEDELKQVPLMPIGARLDEGATYVDLRDPARREFAASAEMQVPPDGLYVPRSAVDHRIWVRLLGLRTADRIERR